MDNKNENKLDADAVIAELYGKLSELIGVCDGNYRELIEECHVALAHAAEWRKEIRFRTKSDPEANGRVPLKGDQRYTLKFPLDDGRELFLEIGREDMSHFAKMIAQMMVDDDTDGLLQSL